MNPRTEAAIGRKGEGWPTTLRFSRYLGEAQRGADYAIAVEGPASRDSLRAALAALWRPLRRRLWGR